jgi:hypothetical protein
MTHSKRLVLGTLMNIAVWEFLIWFAKVQTAASSPGENYGIILAWGVSLYVASLVDTPLIAAAVCVLLSALWQVTFGWSRVFNGDMPNWVGILVVLARAGVFASPIALNRLVQFVLQAASRKHIQKSA